MRIPIGRKRLAAKSIVGIAIENRQRMDEVVDPESQLSQHERDQHKDQSVSAESQDAL
jgi:hypothetical protein